MQQQKKSSDFCVLFQNGVSLTFIADPIDADADPDADFEVELEHKFVVLRCDARFFSRFFRVFGFGSGWPNYLLLGGIGFGRSNYRKKWSLQKIGPSIFLRNDEVRFVSLRFGSWAINVLFDDHHCFSCDKAFVLKTARLWQWHSGEGHYSWIKPFFTPFLP